MIQTLRFLFLVFFMSRCDMPGFNLFFQGIFSFRLQRMKSLKRGFSPFMISSFLFWLWHRIGEDMLCYACVSVFRLYLEFPESSILIQEMSLKGNGMNNCKMRNEMVQIPRRIYPSQQLNPQDRRICMYSSYLNAMQNFAIRICG